MLLIMKFFYTENIPEILKKDQMYFADILTLFDKMVKRTQTIRRQIADELFECVWLFWGIGA